MTKQLQWDAVTRDRDCKRRRAAETCQTLDGFLKRPVKLSDHSDDVSSNSRQQILEPWRSLVQDEDNKQLPMPKGEVHSLVP